LRAPPEQPTVIVTLPASGSCQFVSINAVWPAAGEGETRIQIAGVRRVDGDRPGAAFAPDAQTGQDSARRQRESGRSARGRIVKID